MFAAMKSPKRQETQSRKTADQAGPGQSIQRSSETITVGEIKTEKNSFLDRFYIVDRQVFEVP